MTLWSALYTIFISPLRLVFEVLFAYANTVLENPGACIIVLALGMNIPLWPLHRCLDKMYEPNGVMHNSWSGRKPLLLLRCILPLLLEIFFFIATYSLLSGMTLLVGASFGPIRNLAAPDGLLTMFGVSINLLPLIMTVVQLACVVFLTKGELLPKKIARYAMALLLLVLLYNAASSLNLCWLVGSFFWLGMRAVAMQAEPRKVLRIISAVCGVLLIAIGIMFLSGIKLAFFVLVGIMLLIPLAYSYLKKKGKFIFSVSESKAEPRGKLFLFEMFFLSLLAGLWIPSSVINASPLEFISSFSFYHPLWYVFSSLCMAVGFFMIWLGAFYWLASPRVKVTFERIAFIVCGVTIVDYVFFGRGLGLLSTALKYENGLSFDTVEILVNAVVVLAVGALLYWVSVRWKDIARSAMLVCALALVAMSAVNLFAIGVSVDGYLKTKGVSSGENTINLSREGENVIVLMLDRAAGHLVPYIMNEKPELAEQFSGFTFYDNTITFGPCTNIATPALFGGYEYTPVEINKRADETLVSKQNEALRVMPVMFSNAGYNVTVYDPPWAGYKWIPDLSIYDDHPEIKVGITMGSYNGIYTNEDEAKKTGRERNFFCYSIVKMAPLCIQPTLYENGEYRHLVDRSELSSGMNSSFSSYPTDSAQTEQSEYKAYGIYTSFLDSYTVLMHLKDITQVVDAEKGTFLMMSNDTTHEQNLLQAPDYTPSYMVDNTDFENEHADRFTLDGITWEPEDFQGYSHYYVNMATFLKLGEWFDYLKELGVYDNTRIILVSDHSDNRIGNMESLVHMVDGLDEQLDVKRYYPLLMVKDFNASGALKTDSTFMTNADVPTLATEGVIEKPENPFTGNPINNLAKQADRIYIFGSTEWEATVNNGNTFMPDDWYSVHDDLWDENNWAYEGYGTLPEGVES